MSDEQSNDTPKREGSDSASGSAKLDGGEPLIVDWQLIGSDGKPLDARFFDGRAAAPNGAGPYRTAGDVDLYPKPEPADGDLVSFVRDLARLARAEGIETLTVDGITLSMGPPLPKPASAADMLDEADDDEEQRTRFRERDTSRKYAATPIRPRQRPQPPRVGD